MHSSHLAFDFLPVVVLNLLYIKFRDRVLLLDIVEHVWLLEDVFRQAYEDILTEKSQQNLNLDAPTNLRSIL